MRERTVQVSEDDLRAVLDRHLSWDHGAGLRDDFKRLRAALKPERCPTVSKWWVNRGTDVVHPNNYDHASCPTYGCKPLFQCRHQAGHHSWGSVDASVCDKPADDPVHAAPAAPDGCQPNSNVWEVKP